MLSVIIPTCNRPDDLVNCLERLAPGVQSLSVDQFEVIVTDDGRKTPAESLCEQNFCWVRWTRGPAKGPAANRNHGATLAKHNWLVFIDDDCLAVENLLEEYARIAKGYSCQDLVVLEGPTLRTEEPPSLQWEAPHNPSGDTDISANFAINRKAFETVGRFDERYPSAAIEDTEFFSRFRLTGGQVRFVSEAIVYHPLRSLSSGKSLASKWQGKVILALDQGTPPFTIVWRLPWHVLRVIQSRFRGQRFSVENIRVSFVFAREWMGVVAATIPWVRHWSRKPRSAFWTEQTKKYGPPPKYGF